MIRVAHHEFGPREHDAIRVIGGNISNIERYTRHFAAALQLFDYCDWQASQLAAMGDCSKDGMLNSWRQLAARDGAMTVFHFGKSMNGARNALRLCPQAAAKVDRAKLKAAGRLFNSHFARHEALRHAVAHSAELSDSEQSRKRNSFTGSHVGAGFSISHSVEAVIRDILYDRTFTTTSEGKFLSYDLSRETLDKLQEVKAIFYDAFGPLLQRWPAGMFGPNRPQR